MVFKLSVIYKYKLFMFDIKMNINIFKFYFIIKFDYVGGKVKLYFVNG